MKDRDKLSFRARSRLLPLIGALLLALAITGAMFIYYTYTTAALTLTAGTGYGEFATVEPASADTPAWPTMWMRWKGKLWGGDLFTITPQANYNGDLVVKVSLVNVGDLVKGYMFLNMKLQLWDCAVANHGTGNNVTDSAWQSGGSAHEWKLLSLENGVATFALKSYTAGNTYYVYLAGGSFHTHPWSTFIGATSVSPEFYCEVTQAE